MASPASHATGKADDLGKVFELVQVPVTKPLPRRTPGVGSPGEAGESGQDAGVPAAQPLPVWNAQIQYIEAVADGADEAAASTAQAFLAQSLPISYLYGLPDLMAGSIGGHGISNQLLTPGLLLIVLQ